jgi:hypothetical protein
MTPKARNLVLTKSQAACLIALRHRKDSKTEIAIQAKLDLIKTAAELGVLARLGLAKHSRAKGWHTTARGKACRLKTVPDRLRRNSGFPGPGARRLLELLDRPMRGSEIAEKLGVQSSESSPAYDQAARTRTCELRGPGEPLLDRDARG